MATTEILAALIGRYFCAAGTGLLVERSSATELVRALIAQPVLGFLGGIIAFAIGGAIVGVQNRWDGLLAGIVSLVGWMCLLEGALMLACRQWFLGLFARLVLSSQIVTIFALGTIAAGAALLATAFFG